MDDAQVQWPKGEQFTQLNELVLTRHPLLCGAFGTINSLNLPVEVSGDDELENATYNGWLHAHFVSSVLAYLAEGVFFHFIRSLYQLTFDRYNYCMPTQCTRKLA
jgi:hypothetical protein